MTVDAASWGLVTATFLACFVEMVEAATILMAIGVTRGWRSVVAGTVTALLALAAFTVTAGYAIATWLPTSALQLVIGGLMLVFGLQWLRKAILRSSGLKAMHDEDEIYREEVAAAEAAARTGGGIDLFAFVVSFKGVFLEGVEVVFIVITFGLNADDVPLAATGAGAAALLVLVIALVLRKPLAMIPENTLKYSVGVMLAAFGTYWAVEGIGVFRAERESLEWLGDDLALLALIALWVLVSRALVRALRVPSVPVASAAAEAGSAEGAVR
jgi:uncharacterized membrane protein